VKRKGRSPKSRATRRYKTQDICEIFDISKATLFRWERDGLISSVGRDWRNWRLYTERNVQEIRAMIRGRSVRH
jgi:DNA-binding transcriptional MerR regulator